MYANYIFILGNYKKIDKNRILLINISIHFQSLLPNIAKPNIAEGANWVKFI